MICETFTRTSKSRAFADDCIPCFVRLSLGHQRKQAYPIFLALESVDIVTVVVR